MNERLFRDDRGFTTLSMTVALLLCLSLIFTSAQVYRINSASAEIQDVADAASSAAQAQVAEFMIAVQVCDAVALSLSLASSVSMGIGVACLCVPVAAPFSSGFVQAGETFLEAKSSFLKTAKTGLQAFQRALPYLSAVRAAQVAASNNALHGARYCAVAVSLPFQGDDIDIPDDTQSGKDLADAVKQDSASIREKSEDAEAMAQEALEAKKRGFLADCGEGSYCMQERALSLAGLSGSDNPTYSSVDTWSFSVALDRARAYYRERQESEMPSSSSAVDQSQSVVRAHFYQYACEELKKGYVTETEESFSAYFPVLPRNMQQLRESELYGKNLFPITSEEGISTMHGWAGCPNAASFSRKGSVRELEANEDSFQTCTACEFVPESLGNVAAATSSIKTGFEYYYLRVASAAQDYQKARQELDPLSSQVKQSAKNLFEKCASFCKEASAARIAANPPGKDGAIAVVIDASSKQLPAWTLAGGQKTLGARFAVSGAALMEDSSEAGGTVLSGFLDGFSSQAQEALGPLDAAMRCWSGLLETYGAGQEALTETIEGLLNDIPFVGASGLGTWASKTFCEIIKQLGLQPAKLKALKPLTVNTSSVADASDTSLAHGYAQVKNGVLKCAEAVDGVLSWSNNALSSNEQGISFVGEVIEIAQFNPFGDAGPSFTFSLPLPSAAWSTLDKAIAGLARDVRGVVEKLGGLIRWQ